MMPDNDSEIFIGSGGCRPALWTMTDDAELVKLREMQCGESVYTLKINSESQLLAVATRNGKIILYRYEFADGVIRLEVIGSFIQGRSMLDICLVGENNIVGCDTVGNCYLWSIGNNQPITLEVTDGIVCCLAEIQGEIIGLTHTGKIMTWESATGKILKDISCPVPPGKLALTQFHFQHGQNRLLYPGADGSLVAFKWDTSQVFQLPGHKNAFYAIVPTENNLYTVGFGDGIIIKRNLDGEVIQFSAPIDKEIISGQVISEDRQDFMFIDTTGVIHVYRFNKDHATLIRHLNSEPFRGLTGLSCEERIHRRFSINLQKATELHYEIMENIHAGECEDIGLWYDRLDALGFKDMTLALKAKQARLQQNIIEELRCLSLMNSLAEYGDVFVGQFHNRFVEILNLLWCPDLAWSVRQQYPGDCTSNIDYTLLQEKARIYKQGLWFAKPEIEIEQLIKAAGVLSRPFSGIWVLKSGAAIPLPDPAINAERVAGIYRQLCEKEGILQYRVSTEKRHCLTDKCIDESEVIVFTDKNKSDSPTIIYLIQFQQHEGGSSFTPIVALDAGTVAGDFSQEHNQNVMSVYRNFSRQTVTHKWPPRLFRMITLSLRHAITQFKSTCYNL